MIPYGRQDIDCNDIEAVVEVLRSDFLTQGPAIPRFESSVAQLSGALHAVAVNSATAALHVACRALDLGLGDRLWTVPNTFVASANCARYCGADVDFVDIDPVTWNISLPTLRDKLTQAKRTGTLPKILVPVDFGGLPVPLAEISALGSEFGFKIIEDASHAIGASRNGRPVGAEADIVVFSFHPVKIITSGEGGMAVTNHAALADRMKLLRSHGITRDPSLMTVESPGPWHYEQLELGFNYRLTDIQAALGNSQLARLNDFVRRRNELAQRYKERLSGLKVRWQEDVPGMLSAYHLFVVRVDATKRRSVFAALRASGIGANVHYMPVHLQPYYRGLGFAQGCFPEAEAHGREAITLPLFPAMTEVEQDHVVEVVAEALA